MDDDGAIGDSQQREIIQSILDSGGIEHPVACAIARIVLDKGVDALSDRQLSVFDKYISPFLETEECCVCGAPLGYGDDFSRIGPDSDICCARHMG
ncbi:MAG TPA: hypothetical protein VHY37_06975 [Tepidisphaeraceae bacterium]|jgi:hypothetical protein|nr:hypothetical protein [Tepidisphaeraceae bacterium]